jgi:hypothetical protein
MYESPPRMRARHSPQGASQGLYHSVAGDDAV